MMNKYVSESLCNILERLFPKKELIRIDAGCKQCYIEDEDENWNEIYHPLNLSIKTVASLIPDFDDEHKTPEIVISIPYSSPLVRCLNPKKNTAFIFDTDELLFNIKIHPKQIALYPIDYNEEISNENISEVAIFGTSSVEVTPHIFNRNLIIEDECINNLEKHLTLWALGTKEGEQSLEKYLEKTAKSNGTRL